MSQLNELQPLPRVDLMDLSVEPTDEELELLMKHVGRNAVRKWNKTYKTFKDELSRSMANAAASRASKIKSRTAGQSR